MAEVYEIKTILDIAALRPEQRRACVTDLLAWCAARDMLVDMSGVLSSTFVEVPTSMTWIDDGHHNGTVTIEVVDRREGA